MKSPAYYRGQARKIRLRAARAHGDEWKVIWQQIAMDYEALAHAVERRGPIEVGVRQRPKSATERATRILLIDDDEQLRVLLDYFLRTLGYVVDCAATAHEARSRLAVQKYELVIADARLPDGNGAEIADDANAKGSIAVILTGYAIEQRNSRHDVLFKPIRPDELARVVEQYIGAPSRV
jgi:CheY-like chemotaxis protein